MQAELHLNRTSLRALKADWDRLWQLTENAGPFTSWDWAWHWYSAYAAVATPVVVTVKEADRIVGIAPLARTRPGKLLFVGGIETWPEYATFLAHPADIPAVTAAVLAKLWQAPGIRWWLLELPHVVALGGFARTVGSLAGTNGVSWPAGHTWQIALPDTWDEYLRSITKNRRSSIRRLLKRNRSISIRSVSDGVPFDRAWHELVSLHQRRWQSEGKPGCFSSERFHAFHRALAEKWVGQGRADITLAYDGDRAVAADYLFVFGDRWYGYQAGFDPAYRRQGTGMFLFVELLRRACAAGVTAVDMLSGDQEYKVRFATHRCAIVDYWLSGPGWVSEVAYLTRKSWRAACRAVRRGLEAVRQSAGSRC